MPDPKQPVPSTESITIMAISNNFVPNDPFKDTMTYSSTSYTVTPAEGSQPEGGPSQPLSSAAIRVVNSVLGARVPESAIERDSDGDA